MILAAVFACVACSASVAPGALAAQADLQLKVEGLPDARSEFHARVTLTNLGPEPFTVDGEGLQGEPVEVSVEPAGGGSISISPACRADPESAGRRFECLAGRTISVGERHSWEVAMTYPLAGFHVGLTYSSYHSDDPVFENDFAYYEWMLKAPAAQCKQVLNLTISGTLRNPRPNEVPCVAWRHPKHYEGAPNGGMPSTGCDFDDRGADPVTAYNEISAASQRAKIDRRVIARCRHWHPAGRRSPQGMFFYYGYDRHFGPPYGVKGHGTGRPDRAHHFLELYGRQGGGFAFVTSAARAFWAARKGRYAPMLNIGSPFVQNAALSSGVEGICRALVYKNGYGSMGLYFGPDEARHLGASASKLRANLVYAALKDCLEAVNGR